jgi:hypothetical protein
MVNSGINYYNCIKNKSIIVSGGYSDDIMRNV